MSIIPFPVSRIVRIVPAVQTDVRLEFARRVEERAFQMECEEAARWSRAVSVISGAHRDGRPSDTEEAS